MPTKLLALINLLFLTFCLNVSAGGTVAAGWHNGGYLPKSDGLITWSAYGGALTDQMRDILASATLSVDLETERFWMSADSHPELSLHHVFFSFIGGEPNPKCLDDKPGGCTLGTNECLVWQRSGPYRLCSQNRIRIYISNIQASVSQSGGNFEDKLFRVLRHEWVHPLGFPDGVGGPTSNGASEFTECQLAQMLVYSEDPSIDEWTVVTLEECI